MSVVNESVPATATKLPAKKPEPLLYEETIQDKMVSKNQQLRCSYEKSSFS